MTWHTLFYVSLILYVLSPVLSGIASAVRQAFAEARVIYGVGNFTLVKWLITGEKRNAS